jgi:hypothetical protein
MRVDAAPHRVVAAGRNETGLPLRQNALDPGFHRVPTGLERRTVLLMVPV